MIAIPYIALLFAWVLIYVPRAVALREMRKLAGGYNNREPRTQQAELEGLGRRAIAAHLNGFEAFAPFAAGVLAAIQRGIGMRVIAALAVAFVVVRVIYLAAYLDDRPWLRSGMWGLSMGATGALLLLAVIGHAS